MVERQAMLPSSLLVLAAETAAPWPTYQQQQLTPFVALTVKVGFMCQQEHMGYHYWLEPG
jgi:hypothetical protein